MQADNSVNSKQKTNQLKAPFSFDEGEVSSYLDDKIREIVGQALNEYLDHEADLLCGAGKYERTDTRNDTRAGSYSRNLHTKAGNIELKVPRLRTLAFHTDIIERYKRKEASVEESLIEMYLAGVSTRRVSDITEALWDTSVSSSTASKVNKQVYEQLKQWRNKPIEGEHPYVYLDGTYLKRSWGGQVRNVAILVAVGVSEDGYREILGVCEGSKEDKASWLSFLRHLKERGLSGNRLFISDACVGLLESLEQVFPESSHQRCVVHWYRNAWSRVPKSKVKQVSMMLKAIHSQEDKESSRKKAGEVAVKLRSIKLNSAASFVEDTVEQTLSYMDFPSEHWVRIRTNNMLERLMKEIKRRTKVVGSFPDGDSALMLCSARLRYVADGQWGSKRYLDMSRLYELEAEHKRQLEQEQKEQYNREEVVNELAAAA